MKTKSWMLEMARGAICAVACCAAVAAPARDEDFPDRLKEGIDEGVNDARAQSGAAAADEARIYTAQLKRCEGLSGTQREACVELARKRLGQM